MPMPAPAIRPYPSTSSVRPEALLSDLNHKRFRREPWQQRLTTLRSAAADLFAAEMPVAPQVALPETVNALLATAWGPGGD